jgi:hypothetical protein
VKLNDTCRSTGVMETTICCMLMSGFASTLRGRRQQLDNLLIYRN